MSISLFEQNISEQPFYYIIGCYLNIEDNKNMLLLNKSIFSNKTNKQYFTKIIKYIAYNIITNFMKRYTYFSKYTKNNIDSDLKFTKKMNAVYYFQTYQQKYIDDFFNMDIPWKKNIIDTYQTNKLSIYTRLDLYNLIKIMNISDVYNIGW
jgi:hypothetical protein